MLAGEDVKYPYISAILILDFSGIVETLILSEAPRFRMEK